MNYIQKIKRLYDLSENKNYGFSENQILTLEKKLDIELPIKFKEYYLELGIEENLNYSFNRLLKPENEIGFSDDSFLVFYEEHQNVAFWGIKKEDLLQGNPPIYGNYDTVEKLHWEIETSSIENFFLLMAVFNGTLGGLPYNGNYFGEVDPEIVNFIAANYTLISEISKENQKVYTDQFYDVIILSFDKDTNCSGAFIGTSNQERFDSILEQLDIDWSYLSYDDEEDHNEEQL